MKPNLRMTVQIKRPLCAAALMWAAVIWLLGRAGVPGFNFEPPVLPEGTDKEHVRITGTIYKQDDYDLNSNLYLKNSNLILNSKKYPIDCVRVTIRKTKLSKKTVTGSKAAVFGALKEIPLPGNPGQFSERAYYYARNIKWYQNGEYMEILEEDRDILLILQEKIKEKVKRGIFLTAPKGEAKILSAMLLGDRKYMEEDDRQTFQVMGISHILAVSGMHISLIGWGIFKMLRKLHLPVRAAGLLSAAGIFFYGEMTGGSSAALRAAVMFGVSMGALLAGRTYDVLSAASLAAILLLGANPLYLYDCGFLLSFGAVLGLGVVCPAFFPGKKHSLIKGICSGIAVWSILLPVVMYFFYEIPVLGILINLLVLPTVALVLASGMLGGILGMFSISMPGKAAAFLAVCLLRIYRSLGVWTGKLPGAVWITGKPQLWQCCVYYGLLSAAIWRQRKEKKKGRTSGMFVAVGLLVLFFRMPYQGERITFLDVGQGDCACVQAAAGKCYLIDGGSLDVSKVGKYRIVPFLKASGIREIEGVFLSHMDGDHINGITELLEMIEKREVQMKIKRVFLSKCRETEEERKKLEKLGERAGCEIVYIEKGTMIQDKETRIECVAPQKTEGNSNESSQVLVFHYKEFEVLFTGDLEKKGEEQVKKFLEGRENQRFAILKTAHHGSKNSTGEGFLGVVRPAVAVISCGRDNRYGHPHEELLERLRRANTKILKTPDCGAIFVSCDGKNMEISFQYKEIMIE